ncbi:type II toxin-antitoxin system HicA family toxin [Brevundimonas nasdae]|uniref:type II toxin-antitoxin system HicA family toxin n=1 Tax=Brevundimonas nasdae TaxID=172043 RepID=UPI001912B473|nr:type II toxin-antitoxin system HicA family toxin [Brevundimonas nasdae]
MPRLNCTFAQVLEILLRNGFVLHRQGSGSHQIYRRAAGSKVWLVTVAYHTKSDDVPIGTLKSIIRDSGLSQKLFRR